MPIHLRRVDHDPWADPNIQPVVFGSEQAASRTGGPSNVPVAQAKEMAAQGKNADTIFQATGWDRAPDGKWYYNISDENAVLKKDAFHQLLDAQGKPTTLRLNPQAKAGSKIFLPDVLDHPDLYKAYPNLKNTTVGIMPDTENGVMADFSYADNHIRIGEGDPRRLTMSLLHEIQHDIQKEERGAPGATPSSYYPSNRAPTEQEINQARKDYYRTAGEVQAYQVGEQYKRQNWSERPTAMPGFPAPAEQIVRGPEEVSGYGRPGVAYQMADKEALPTTPAPFDSLDYTDKYNTKLPPKQEQQYQQWLKTLPEQQRNTYDYDMRGAFKASAGQSENNHFPDTFKKPNHPSFSDQSIYHGQDGQQGGSWAKDDQGKWSFTPGSANLEMHGPDRLRDYFQRSDPDVKVNLPASKPTQALPFDPWDSGRSMAPTDIAPLTDVSQGVRDYAHDVVTGEVARRGLEYYNQHPGEAALALSGGGLSVKGAGPNVIPLSRPRTYEAAQGDARAAIAEPRGYALGIGERGAEMAPFGTVPEHSMSQPRGPAQPLRPGEALPEGTALKPLEPTNTNAPTYPIAGGYRLMPAFTKKDQWSIIDPRGEIMFRSPDKATTQKVFDFVNKGTTGLAVGGGALAAGDQAYAGQRSGSQNYLQVVGEAKAPYPKDVQDFYDYVRSYPRQAPGQDPNWILNNVPSQQALGYDLEEVDHDPFTPGIQTASQVQPRQIPFTPSQAISTLPWSFGNNAPDATPTRFSDIAPPLNYYQPLSNTNGVPTYGG